LTFILDSLHERLAQRLFFDESLGSKDVVVANIEHQSTSLLNQFVLLLLVNCYGSANAPELAINGE
jgi:hypothetical protein